MEKGDSIPNYLTKFTHFQDELGSVRITISKDDMVSLALLRLPKRRHSYEDYINCREKILDQEQLWSDSVEEDIQRNTRDVTSSNEVEVDFSLVRKGRKFKENKSQGEAGGNKMDL